jgi:cytochrome P450
MSLTPVESIDEQLLSPNFMQDPYPVYRQMRETSPVYRSEALSQWMVTGTDEVAEIMKSPEQFSSFGWELARINRLPKEARERLGPLVKLSSTPVIVFSDPPEHTRLRKFVNRTFSASSIKGSQPEIQSLANRLVERLVAEDEPELVQGLAQPLPIQTVVRIFGAPVSDAEIYKTLSHSRMIFQGTRIPDPDAAMRLNELLIEFREYLFALIGRLQQQPEEGLLSRLIQPDEDGDKLDDDELFHMCVVFLSAGHETTTALIGNTVLALLQNPEQMALLREDPEKVPAAVQESLRWIAPVQRVLRIAATDVEIGGQTIRAGDEVALILASVNRDPDHFPDPDRFYLDRPRTNQMLAFGRGIHNCVGATLARSEASAALSALIEKAPDLRLPQRWSPEWSRSISIRSQVSLPVVV